MLIPLQTASQYLETSVDSIYSNPKKFKRFIKNRKFDITAWKEEEKKKQEEEDRKYNALNFADFLIEYLGESSFYKAISSKDRQEVKRAVERCRISLRIVKVVEETFKSYKEAYVNSFDNKKSKKQYIPLEEREPLTKHFFIVHYWQGRKTIETIAEELNVPDSWVWKECKRVGATKKENGIKRLGRKGYKMPKEQRKKHENQPHAKPVVRICPRTFKILKEYSSQGAVERDGFSRENVRKAIKRAGLHKGYLWAFKGFEKPVVEFAKKRGNLETKLRAREYKRPSKEELKKYYIDMNMSFKECSKVFKCHHTTLAILASRYGIKKYGKRIDEKQLREFIEKRMSVEEIAEETGYSVKTIRTYLSRFKISSNSTLLRGGGKKWMRMRL